MVSDKEWKAGRTIEKWMVQILENIMHLGGDGLLELKVGCSFTAYTGPPFKDTTEASYYK